MVGHSQELDYFVFVPLSPRLLLLNREILFLTRRMVLWQGRILAQNYGGPSPEILQRN